MDASKQPWIEPYHRTYLAALKDEGIDLPRFIVRWRESAYDDIARLHDAMRTADVLSAKRILHSLSGTAGLVGAVPLAEALHVASAGAEVKTDNVVALISRLDNLIGQLCDVAAFLVEHHDSPSRPD